MEEVMRLIQAYDGALAKAAVLVMGVILIILAAGISRKIKRLDKSLESIVGNMQAYFDVILQEEEEQEPQITPVKVRQTYPSSDARNGQAHPSTEGAGKAFTEQSNGQAYDAGTRTSQNGTATEVRSSQTVSRSVEVGRQANGLKEQKNMEDEKLVNAMLQEYFS